MPWTVRNHDDFDPEFDGLPLEVQDELLAMTALLEVYGPALGRPHADTLAGSKHANMKELRFKAADGVWRVAFAFDPERQAILLVDKHLDAIKKIADRHVVIEKGNVVWTGTTAQLAADPTVRQRYLQV